MLQVGPAREGGANVMAMTLMMVMMMMMGVSKNDLFLYYGLYYVNDLYGFCLEERAVSTQRRGGLNSVSTLRKKSMHVTGIVCIP